MKWLIDELESQISMYGLADNTKKISDLKRAIVAIQKNGNVFHFPKVMNFRSIEQRPATLPPIVQPPPLPKPNNNPKPYPGIAPSPCPSPTAMATIDASNIFNNYHEPSVGEEIFGIFKNEDDSYGQCIYTWQEKDNPKEITAYAIGLDTKFSAGQKWMPCRKRESDKFLVICTNECCGQPE